MAFGRRKVQAAVGTATAADVLTGYTFSSAVAGIGVAGTMPNQGSPTLQPGQTLAAGYYSGGQAAVPGSGSQIFSTPGPFSFTVPSGVTRLTTVLTGAGGGGNCTPGWNLLGSTAVATSISVSVTQGHTILVLYGDATNSNGGSISGICTVGSVTATNFLAANNAAGATFSLGVLGFYATANTSGTVTVSLSNLTGFQSAGTYAILFVIDVGRNVIPSVTGFGASTLPSTSGTQVTVDFSAQNTSCINLVGEQSNIASNVSVGWTGNVSGDTAFNQPQIYGDNITFMSIAFFNPSQSGSATWSNTNDDTRHAYVYGTILLSNSGGGGAIALIDLIDVLPGQTITGIVGAGGTSGSGGNTTLTVGNTTWTANGGGAASASGPGTGGAASTQAGVYLSSAGQNGMSFAGGMAGSLNGQVGGGTGAINQSASLIPGAGGAGYVYWTASGTYTNGHNGNPGESPGGGGAGGGQAYEVSAAGTSEGAAGAAGGALVAFFDNAGNAVGPAITYTQAGTYSVSVPATATSVRAVLIGAGGGGGGGTIYGAGGGGGGGACVDVTVPLPSGTTSVSLIVGSGGSYGLSRGDEGGPTAGGAGGATQLTVGSQTISAAGGAGGGAAPTNNYTGGTGGSGGAATTSAPSGWTLNASYAGGNGAAGYGSGANTVDGNGPGGGAAGNAGAGGTASTPGSGTVGAIVSGGSAGAAQQLLFSSPAGIGGGGWGSFSGGNGQVILYW